MILTTNKSIDAWGRVLHGPDLSAAIVDRVLIRAGSPPPDRGSLSLDPSPRPWRSHGGMSVNSSCQNIRNPQPRTGRKGEAGQGSSRESPTTNSPNRATPPARPSARCYRGVVHPDVGNPVERTPVYSAITLRDTPDFPHGPPSLVSSL